MDTKKIKEYVLFLKAGWWVVAWILFIGFFNFWCFLSLGVFGVTSVFSHGGSFLFWIDMLLSTISSLFVLYLVFNIIYEDEYENSN